MTTLARDIALSARPERTPVVRTVERDDGGLKVVVRLVRPPWLRWLGGRPREFERTYGLDVLGREVYEACDGRTTVKTLMRNFEKRHHVSPAEAETAVAAFLRTLIAKGLVVMALDREIISSAEKGKRT